MAIDESDLIAWAAGLCRSAWGIDGRLTPLASERDRIFRVESADGRRLILKFTNPDETPLATDFQTRGLLHAAARDPGLPIPRLVPDREGRVAFRPDTWPFDRPPTARLMTWLDGDLVAHSARSPAQARALGRTLAQLGQALADFDHPGADHYLIWDLVHTSDHRPRLAAVADPAGRALVEAAIDRFDRTTAPALAAVRRQVLHADLTPYNALVDPAAPDRVTGIIDFGDLVRTALVCDVAIAACYLMGDGDDAMALPEALAAGFHAVRPLARDEVLLIAPLMEARHAMTVAITEHHAARVPGNRAYITKNTATAWRGLTTFAGRTPDAWGSRFLHACGMDT